MPLPADMLQVLRAWWRLGQPAHWLFPAQSDASKPLDVDSAQRWYRTACAIAGITKQGGIHTLRQYSASRNIPREVGGARAAGVIGSVARYTHLTSHTSALAGERIAALMSRFTLNWGSVK